MRHAHLGDAMRQVCLFSVWWRPRPEPSFATVARTARRSWLAGVAGGGALLIRAGDVLRHLQDSTRCGACAVRCPLERTSRRGRRALRLRRGRRDGRRVPAAGGPALSAAIGAVADRGEHVLAGGVVLWRSLQAVATLAVAFAVFLGTVRFVADVKVRWQDAAVGARSPRPSSC